jgi:hypothetical protein
VRALAFVSIAALLILTYGAAAAGNRDDWRVYSLAGDDVRFYSVPSIVRSPENETNAKAGTIRVWTQTISGQALATAMTTKGKVGTPFADTIVSRTKALYVPPYFSVEALTVDADETVKHALVFSLEEAANQQMAPASHEILFELDCGNGRQRILQSISSAAKGNAPNLNTVASDWVYVSPHSIGEDLQTLVCDKKLTAPDNTPK